MNIETEFLKFKADPNVFPHQKNYAELYLTFKERFITDIHPEIKSRMIEIEKDGYFNDHGVEHINMVIERCSRIIVNHKPKFTLDNVEGYITPYELFILLMSIQLHDAGHLIVKRKDHAKAAKELLAKMDRDSNLSAAEKTWIGNIAQAHGGKDDPIGKLENKTRLSGQEIRPQFLASLLRLGDELAEDETRASNFLLSEDLIESKTSIIFHVYSASLNDIHPEGNEISLQFYLTDKYLNKRFPVKKDDKEIEKMIIDEIYDRTIKTHLEALYCARFLPADCRFTKVKVKIHLLAEKNHGDILPPIGYELVEIGYPTNNISSIFDMCESLWVDGKKNGQKLDGEYISSQVTEKLKINEESI